MGLKHLLYEERLKGLVKRWLKGDLISVYKYLMGRDEEDRARLFSVVPSERSRGSGHKQIQKIPLKLKIIFLYCDGGQTLEQVAHRGWGVLGDIQNPAGHSPESLLYVTVL